METDIAVFKACSDVTRLRILFLLAGRELCVCELTAVLDMAQGKVSRHLAILKQTGLVADRREGLWVYYEVVHQQRGAGGQIREYLVRERLDSEVALRDEAQLNRLSERGVICVPRPSASAVLQPQ